MDHTPSANAKKLTVYGKVVALTTEKIFTDHSIKAVYFDNGVWYYLAQPSFYPSEIDTKEKCDEVLNQALSSINAAINDVIKPKEQGDEPENGIERIEWLMGNLTVVNDVIVK